MTSLGIRRICQLPLLVYFRENFLWSFVLMYKDFLLILNQMEDSSILSVLDKIGIFAQRCKMEILSQNGNINLILDLRVVRSWLPRWNISALKAGEAPLKNFITLTQTH